MFVQAFRVQALAALLTVSFCGCSIVGLGYRAGHSHSSARAEAARLSKLAQLYERQGHSDGAMRLYRQALHVDPRSQVVRERLMALSTQRATQHALPVVPSPTPVTAIAGAVSPSGSGASPVKPVESAASVTQRHAAAPPVRSGHENQIAAALAATPATPGAWMPAMSKSLVGAVAAEPAAVEAAGPAVASTAPAAMPLVPAPRAATMERAAAPIAETRATSPSREEPAQNDLRRAIPNVPALDDLLAASARPAAAAASSLPAADGLPGSRSSLSVASSPVPLVAPEIQPSVVPHAAGWAATGQQDPGAAPSTVSTPAHAGVEIRPHAAESAATAYISLEAPDWSPTDPDRQRPAPSEALPSMIRRLQSSDSLVRKDALLELAELGSQVGQTGDAVRGLLDDSDPIIRVYAAWVVCRNSGPQAECLQTLASVLQSDIPGAASFAAYCLGLLEANASPVIPELQIACDSEIPEVRLCAAEALVKVTPEAAEPVAILFSSLREAEPTHRWLAALALAAVSRDYQESAILALVPMLRDPDSDVSASAALALGAYGSAAASAVPDLEGLLMHPVDDVRDAASAALTCIRE